MGIPLPALAIKTPVPENPLIQAGRALQIKNQMGQGQLIQNESTLQGQQIQFNAQKLRDQQIWGDAYRVKMGKGNGSPDAPPGTPNPSMPAAPPIGTSPDGRPSLQRRPKSSEIAEAPGTATGAGSPETNFETPLSAQQEVAFHSWKEKNAPNDSGEDYDLRGAFAAGITPDPKTGHFPDTFKKPNHPTFSDQSKYAQYGNPGIWIDSKTNQPSAEGDAYVPGYQPGEAGYKPPTPAGKPQAAQPVAPKPPDAAKTPSGRADENPFQSYIDDLKDALDIAVRNGLSMDARREVVKQIQGLQKQGQEYMKASADHQKLIDEHVEKVHSALSGAIAGIEQLPPEQWAAVYPSIRARVIAGAPELESQLPPPDQFPTDPVAAKALLEGAKLGLMLGKDAMTALNAQGTTAARQKTADVSAQRLNLTTQEKIPTLVWNNLSGVNSQASLDQARGYIARKVKAGSLPQDVLDKVPDEYSPEAMQALKQAAVSPADQARIPESTQQVNEYIDKHPGTSRADARAAIAAQETTAKGQATLDLAGSPKALDVTEKKAGAAAKGAAPYRTAADQNAKLAATSINRIRAEAQQAVAHPTDAQRDDPNFNLQSEMERLAQKYHSMSLRDLEGMAGPRQQSQKEITDALQKLIDE